MDPKDQESSFTGHLAELRYRLIYSLLFLAVAFAACWYYSTELFNFIRIPIAAYLPEGQGLVFTGVMDKFVAYVKVALLAAIIVSCPFWLFQVWRFVSPGLYEKERKYGGLFIIMGTVLFCTGVVFVYTVVFPLCFDFLLNFGDPNDKPMITIADYTSFFFMMSLVFGLVFELPMVLLILAILGVIDADFLRKKRRYAIVALAVVAGVATPSPDLTSMFAMLIPLVALYEFSIYLVLLLVRKTKVTEKV